MRDVLFFRNSYKIKSDISKFFKKYWVVILLLTCLFILGLITGIITASKHSGNLELENIPDENLIKFLCGDKSNFAVFFSYLLPIGGALILIIFFNFNFLCSLVNYFYIVIRGYSLGFTIYALIGLFSFGGIIAVIIITPFWICGNLVIVLISAICISKNRIINHYGKVCYIRTNHKNLIILLCLILILLLFLLCLIMPVLKITIIVN